jgi:hypothetical protein
VELKQAHLPAHNSIYDVADNFQFEDDRPGRETLALASGRERRKWFVLSLSSKKDWNLACVVLKTARLQRKAYYYAVHRRRDRSGRINDGKASAVDAAQLFDATLADEILRNEILVCARLPVCGGTIELARAGACSEGRERDILQRRLSPVLRRAMCDRANPRHLCIYDETQTGLVPDSSAGAGFAMPGL